jgi:perosamine synthetase
MVPLTRPWMTEAEETAVVDVLRSGWLATGPKTKAFEAAMAERTRCAQAVASSSGTAALELALRALGVGPGDEVLCPALTWPSPAHAVVRLGARVVLVDVDPREWNAGPEAFAAARTDATKAAIVIDQFGNPARPAIAEALAGVPIIEDAACALGSRFADGSPCGSLGAIGCFSLHPRKIITCGEGGVCVTSDPALAEAMRVMRNHGQRGPADFAAPDGNLRLSDLAAAVAVAQLERLDAILEARREHAEAMRERLGERYQLQQSPDGSVPNHQTFGALLAEGRERDAFIAAAAERGVQVGRLSYAVDRLGQVGEQGPLPVAHTLAERGVAFPLFGTMTEAERETVIEVLEALA